MARTNYQIEWHFSEENEADAAQWPPLADTEGEYTRRTMQPRELYIYVVALTLIAGIVLYWIGQQTEHRIATLEQEVVVLQREFAQPQTASIAERGSRNRTTATAAITILPQQLETNYLHFEVGAQMVPLVQSIATVSDAKYAQLHREFGLPVTVPVGKVKIVVDPAITYYKIKENVLILPPPAIAAAQYGIPEVDALVNAVFVGLTDHLLAKALAARSIQPQWLAMTTALKFYLQREYLYNQTWRLHEVFLPRRQLGQTRSINTVLQRISQPSSEREAWLQHSPLAYEVADPLIEYLLYTYGNSHLPTLLDAFEEHETWEALAPAVYGIEATALEDAWHIYLRQQYPRPTK